MDYHEPELQRIDERQIDHLILPAISIFAIRTHVERVRDPAADAVHNPYEREPGIFQVVTAEFWELREA